MKKPTVLLVDDSADLREALALIMHDAPFVLEMAASGREALKLYRERRDAGAPYDLLLLDAALPDFSGFTVAEQIRAAGDETTPIIFCTSYSEPIAHARAHWVHALDVWLKPDVLSDLKERLSQVLAQLKNGAHQAAH